MTKQLKMAVAYSMKYSTKEERCYCVTQILNYILNL